MALPFGWKVRSGSTEEVTVHVVNVARVGIVVKPGMEAGCIHDNLSLLVIFGQIVHINEIDAHA